MLPRFHWSDITTVGHYLGVLILLAGAAMIVPALVALVFGEMRQLGAFVFGIGACAFLGSALRLLTSHGLDRRRSLLLVGFGWLIIGLVAAIPLFFSGSYASPFDAVFDSVSALTSTGVTIALDVDAMSHAQTTWHVLMSFFGAQAVIVIALYTGFFGQGSKLELRDGGNRDRRAQTRIRETGRLVLRVFGVLVVVGTAAATAACLALGLSPAEALMNGFWLAACAVGTSGFVAHTSDLLYFHSLPLQLILSVLMLAGAISFGAYVYLRRGYYRRVARNSEIRTYAVWIAVLVTCVTIIFTQEGVFASLGAFIQNGVVPALSAATTCGMQTFYPEQMGKLISEGVVIWLVLAILLGACSYSTGGGIKAVRVLQVLYWIRYSILRRLVSDRAIIRTRFEQFGSRELSAKDATLATTVCIMYLISAALGSMVFIAYGNDALHSVFEAISYLSNCGMTTSITQEGLPYGLKVCALLLMWVGRVEFIALIAAIVGIILSLSPENLFSNYRSRNLRSVKKRNSGGIAWRRRKGESAKGKPARTGSMRGRAPALLTGLLVASLALGAMHVGTAQAATDGSGGAQVSAQDILTLESAEQYRSESIRSLLSASLRQDGRDVAIAGKAIGEALVADEGHKWVNLRSEGAMIGVYMDNDQADLIANYGRYEHEGDTVLVRGVFHIACADHDGELEVHADEVEIIAHGSSWTANWSPAAFSWGLTLATAGLILMLARRRMLDLPLLGFRRGA